MLYTTQPQQLDGQKRSKLIQNALTSAVKMRYDWTRRRMIISKVIGLISLCRSLPTLDGDMSWEPRCSLVKHELNVYPSIGRQRRKTSPKRGEEVLTAAQLSRQHAL
ncbi:hypothetical protein WMY93_031320 [Mugilogobius chulae]|uniref:Uncharacterized protein n=1 Tax=Mugilogobius chulae TaxID=88201 RepID=A0AAW0MG58_9GOBI